MVQIRITGADVLQKKLATYGKAVNKESGEIIEAIAVSGAKYLANNTRPFGLTSKTKDILIKSVQKDLHRAYFPTETTRQTDSGNYLETRRNRRGRVGKKDPMFISATNFNEIQRQKLQNIGDAKEGWFDAVSNLGKKNRVPAWLKKPITLGNATKKGTGFSTVVSIHNTCKYAYNLIKPADIQKSVGMAYKNYIRFIDRTLKELAKKI